MKGILCCLLFISVNAFGQTELLDSLQRELAQAPSIEVRIDLLNKLSQTYSTLSLTKSEQLAKDALALAQPIGYGAGISSSFNTLGIVYSIRGAYAEGLDYFMQALRLRERAADQSAIASTLANIAGVFRYQHDYDRALDYALRA